MVKLQVPIDKDIRDKWESFARRNGFDSLQAYIRFIAKADVDGRRVNFEESVQLSSESEARYAKQIAEHEELRRQRKTKNYENIDNLMKDLLSDEVD